MRPALCTLMSDGLCRTRLKHAVEDPALCGLVAPPVEPYFTHYREGTDQCRECSLIETLDRGRHARMNPDAPHHVGGASSSGPYGVGRLPMGPGHGEHHRPLEVVELSLVDVAGDVGMDIERRQVRVRHQVPPAAPPVPSLRHPGGRRSPCQGARAPPP